MVITTKRKNSRTRPNKRKRRTIKKNTNRDTKREIPHVNSSTKMPIVYGRIHATWCGHCTAMEPAWKQIEEQNKLKPSGPVLFDIESKELDYKKNKFAKIYKSTLSSNGYPTIYKLYEKGGPVEYYEGDRSEPAIGEWLFGKQKYNM